MRGAGALQATGAPRPRQAHKPLTEAELRRLIGAPSIRRMPTFAVAFRTRAVAGGLLLALPPLLAFALAAGARIERADFAYNNGAEVTTLDPATVSGVPEGRIVRALFEGLCVKDPRTLEPRPGVAESWELDETRTVYTFHLRPNARWTNGDPVTADDFVFSWERFLNPSTAAEYAYQLWYVRGGRQYTLLDDDLLYRPSWVQGCWVRPSTDGRTARIGLSGFQLTSGIAPEDSPRLLVEAGSRLAEHDAFIEFGAGHFHTPLAGTVTAVNDALPQTVSGLLDDPYDRGWMIELELPPGEIERVRAEGELVAAEVYRREWAWPMGVGIRALDPLTLRVELTAPTPYFLDLVAFYPLFPVNRRNLKEARRRWPGSWEIEWLRPENLVTNGPYRILFRRVNDRIRLVKNDDYWDAEHVAFRTIDALAIDHLGTSLNLYLTGEIDWIDRPPANVVPRLLPREDFDPQPYLGTYFYRFNTTRPPFDDPRVRRALALAVDRRAICEKITKAGERPAWGFVPPGMRGYTPAEMRHAAVLGEGYEAGYAADIDQARRLLADAGFGPEGRPFPTFEIHFNTDETHKDVAEVIADGWKRHLGLNVKFLNQEWKVYLDAQKTLDYDVSRSAWIGDYPDPNTFLDMFLTGGENNRTGWSNARYDELIRGAASEADPERRMARFAEAEAILLEEAPILPIYYYVTRNLVNPRLGGFYPNIQDEHFPKFWYWKDDAELARDRAALPPGTVRVPARGPGEGLYSPAAQRERRRP